MANKDITAREEAARLATIEEEQKRQKHIRDALLKTADDIDKDIAAFYRRYAGKNGLSLAEARRRVSEHDVQAFARRAAEMVKNRDFSDEANEQLALYNVTMRLNRLEMLKADIGVLLVDEYDDMQKYFAQSLDATARAEFARQAGILGGTVRHLDKAVAEAVAKPMDGLHYSQRLWSSEALLSADVGGILTSGFITGKHPRELSRLLRRRVDASIEDADRLMVTEMCRVQTEAQRATFAAFGYDRYEYIAEGDERTCSECHAMDGQTYLVEDMEPGVNAPPMHPRCRCSTSAVL